MEKTRTNVTLPKDLLQAIDCLVGKDKRSDFLAEAAREKLARMEFAKIAQRLAGALSPEDYPEFASPDGVQKYIRTLREANDIRYEGKEPEGE